MIMQSTFNFIISRLNCFSQSKTCIVDVAPSPNMQKLLKRTRLAENHAKHKAKRVEEWTFLKQKREAKEGLKLRSKTWTEIIRSERTQRKENYLMGPLSPWPMIKHYAGTHYGTLDPSLIRPIELPERIQPKRIVFKEGDRVCVVQGDEYVKGQIGKITSTSRTSNTVVIEGVKRVCKLDLIYMPKIADHRSCPSEYPNLG